MKHWMVGLGFQVVIFLASAVFFQWDCLEYSLPRLIIYAGHGLQF